MVGAASLGAEIAAARLLAPWFGASTIVWANTIATVLVALSAGYWVGGRLADRDPTIAGLSRVVLVRRRPAGARALRRRARSCASRSQALDRVQAGAFVGSLIGVLVLVAVPVMLLGAVAPYAVRLSVRTVEEAGRVAGRLYAISTIGSLVGTFLSALRAHPARGHAAHVPGLRAGARASSPSRRCSGASSWPRSAVALLLAIPVGTVKATGDARVIWDRETEYQYARVDRAPRRRAAPGAQRGPGGALDLPPGRVADRRLLGRDARAAVRRPSARAAALGGDPRQRRGHDGARLRPLLPARRASTGWRSTRRADRRRAPALRPARARTCTCTPPTRGPFLRQSSRRWDVIVVDAYRQPYIPFYLATREFFGEVRDHLDARAAWCSSTSGTRATPTAWRRSSARRWAGSSRRSCATRSSPPTRVLVGTDAPASARALRRGARARCPPTSRR